jgi:hypothetical protein
MTSRIKQERRLLDADELPLVEKTHHPALGLLPDRDLAELRKLVRERRIARKILPRASAGSCAARPRPRRAGRHG